MFMVYFKADQNFISLNLYTILKLISDEIKQFVVIFSGTNYMNTFDDKNSFV